MATKPPHQPTDQTRKTVRAMAGYGVPHEGIAAVIGIDAKTLRKWYRHELDTATVEANAKIAESLFKQAIDGNTSAAIFWLKARAGWREKQEIDVRVDDVSKLSNEDLIKRAAAILGGVDSSRADD